MGCYKCAYKQNVPGDAHISCQFNWKISDLKPPTANEHGIKNGWYIFPINFDPAWQTEECKAFSTTIDKDKYKVKGNIFDELLEMLKRTV